MKPKPIKRISKYTNLRSAQCVQLPYKTAQSTDKSYDYLLTYDLNKIMLFFYYIYYY